MLKRFPRLRYLTYLFMGIFATLFVFAFAAQANAQSLENRIEDRLKIKKLLFRYLYAMDWRDPEAFAATFTEDGVITWTEGSLEGRAAMHDYIVKMRADEAEAKKEGEITEQILPSLHHSVSNIVIDFEDPSEPNRAKAWSYWTTVDNYTVQEFPRLLSFGHYQDELIKIDGEWYFTYRRVYNETIDKRKSGPQSPLFEFERHRRGENVFVNND